MSLVCVSYVKLCVLFPIIRHTPAQPYDLLHELFMFVLLVICIMLLGQYWWLALALNCVYDILGFI